jgi:GTPase
MQNGLGSADTPATRSGHVALVGRPNVGKSTLMNALVGEKLSIVTPRAQTTRERVFGILSSDNYQIIFVDTPGLLEPKYRLQRAMLETALAAIGDADVVLLLLDATRPDELPTDDVVDLLRGRGQAVIAAINKTDQAAAADIDRLRAWVRARFGIEALALSALNGSGLDRLRETLVSRLPESPFLYPADDLAVQSVRFFVEELIRETVFEQYEEEVPYSTVARVEEFREDRRPIYIRATIYVERDSQKPIILGKGGSAIRELGKAARSKIQQFVDAPVYLDLWVKAMPGWRNKASALKFLGYAVPDEGDGPEVVEK